MNTEMEKNDIRKAIGLLAHYERQDKRLKPILDDLDELYCDL